MPSLVVIRPQTKEKQGGEGGAQCAPTSLYQSSETVKRQSKLSFPRHFNAGFAVLCKHEAASWLKLM